MMYCYGCFTSVHLYCYGVETPYKIEKTSKGEEVLMFLCDKCRDSGPDSIQVYRSDPNSDL